MTRRRQPPERVCLGQACRAQVRVVAGRQVGRVPVPEHRDEDVTARNGEFRMEKSSPLTRRSLLLSLAATGAAGVVAPSVGAAQQASILTKSILSTGEALPAIGLGSWITFNVGDDI